MCDHTFDRAITPLVLTTIYLYILGFDTVHVHISRDAHTTVTGHHGHAMTWQQDFGPISDQARMLPFVQDSINAIRGVEATEQPRRQSTRCTKLTSRRASASGSQSPPVLTSGLTTVHPATTRYAPRREHPSQAQNRHTRGRHGRHSTNLLDGGFESLRPASGILPQPLWVHSPSGTTKPPTRMWF